MHLSQFFSSILFLFWNIDGEPQQQTFRTNSANKVNQTESFRRKTICVRAYSIPLALYIVHNTGPNTHYMRPLCDCYWYSTFFFLLTVRAWACINCVGSTTADHRIESVSVSRSLKSDGNLFASIWRNNYLLCVFQELIFVIVGISIGFVWTKSWRIYRAILTCGALYECNLWTKQQ